MKNCTNSFFNWIMEHRFLMLLLIVLMLPFSTLKAQELAKPADAFVESIGIGDRFDWLNDDGLLPKAQIALSSLKIRYVRVGIAAQSGSSTYIANSKNMASALGVKLCVLTDVSNTWSTQQAWLTTWRGYAGTYAVEGPNEVGNNSAVAGIQQNIWNYAKPLGMEVYAWTLGAQAGYYRTEGISNGGATVDDYCDYLNFHPYHWYSYNYAANKMNGLWQNGDFDNLGFGTSGCIDQVRTMAGNQSKPFVSTEFGWCINGLEQGVGINYAKKYVVRNCFENFNSGMHRGFIFSLTDYGGAGADYALSSSTTGALNATGQALANTISILQEPGQNNTSTTSLNYSLTSISSTGGNSALSFSDDKNMLNDEIHHTLLQKSNGVFYLILWSDYDSHNGEDGWAQNAILTLPAGATSVKAYLPLNGTNVVTDFGSVSSGGTVSLNSSTGTAIPDHPIVIEITTGSVSGTAPTVSTTSISSITSTTASSGGNVTADGGTSVTARGVCWSTSANPTIANSKTTDGSGTGSFTSSITGLTASTTYNVRAYATNSAGTSYGSNVTFTTSAAGGGGSLIGSVAISTSAVNLTSIGTADWKHFRSNVRKSSGSNSISNPTVIGGSAINYTNDLRTMSWTGGTPTANGTNVSTGKYKAGVGNGFSFTAPAGNGTNTLYVYVGGWNSSGTLTAHLSNSAAPDYVNTTSSYSTQYDAVYTITYNAAQTGQTLTVTWKQEAGTGNVTIQAAALGGSSAFARVASPKSETGTLKSETENPLSGTVLVYPNPASTFVTIDFNNLKEENVKVEMMDLLGHKVYDSGTLSQISTLQINISAYPKGNYIIRIKKGSEQATKKLVIE